MSEPTSPKERLRAHVESILDRSAIGRAARDDLAEELYGHLWQRWRDEVENGHSEDEAVAAAIGGFGEADRLGPDLTAAFHSRLYASTIGVLVPAAAAAGSGRPRGYARAMLLLGLSVVLDLVVGGVWVLGLSPVRSVAAAVSVAISLAAATLAFRAFARGQRWALVFVQLFSLGFVARLVFFNLTRPLTIDLQGVVAAAVLAAAFGPELAAWVERSRPTGGIGAAVILASLVAYFGAPGLVDAMPDPSLATARDVSIALRLDCTRSAAGRVTAVDAMATIEWRRTDLLPNWPSGTLQRTDNLGLSAMTGLTPDFVPPDGGLLEMAPGFGDLVITGSEVTQGGAAAPGWHDGTRFGGGPYVGTAFVGIEPPAIRAGRTYAATWHFISSRTSGIEGEPLVRVRYDHQGRFGLEAAATCSRPGTSREVDLPAFPPGYQPVFP